MKWVCPMCNESFETKAELIAHYREQHGGECICEDAWKFKPKNLIYVFDPIPDWDAANAQLVKCKICGRKWVMITQDYWSGSGVSHTVALKAFDDNDST